MKHLFTFIIGLILSVAAFAQMSEDMFVSYYSMAGKKAIIYNAYSSFLTNGPYAYENIKGKFKLLKDSTVYHSIDSVPLSVVEIVQAKKKQFLHIKVEGDSVYLLLDGKNDFIHETRSITYWINLFNGVIRDYSYITYSSPLINIGREKDNLLLNKYLPVSWHSVQYPKTINKPFTIECEVNGEKYYWTIDDLKDYPSSFLSSQEFEVEKALYEERLSAEYQERLRRDSTTICEAIILHTTEAGAILEGKDINKYDEEDTLYLSIFSYEDKTTGPSYNKKQVRYYKGYTLGQEFSFPASALSFTDESAKEFIESRGVAGVETRKAVALKNDDKRGNEYVQRIVERAEWQLERLNALEKFRQQKKILIISQEYSFSSYQFGLKFGLFNCYQKDIKYVNLTITAYNRVGDIQRDDIGRSKTEVRCIGPLAKGETGVYDFDDLFWDENDIIDKLAVTNVKITFMDNSVVSYSGQKSVELHMARHYAEEQMKILQEGKK